MKVGVKLHQLGASWNELQLAWAEAEESGFSSIWVFDHFIPRQSGQECMEAWSLLTALATLTSTPRIGVLVTCAGYRHPAVLANVAGTVDQISRGRLDIGLGAGSKFAGTDLRAFGMDFPPLSRRIEQLDEACQILSGVWLEDQFKFNGKVYELRDVRSGARPVQAPHPPIIVGGGSSGVLEVAARHASEWNYSTTVPKDFAEKSSKLDETCRKLGRSPGSISKSVQVFLKVVEEGSLVDLLKEFEDLGAGRAILIPDPPYTKGKVEAIADQVLPHFT